MSELKLFDVRFKLNSGLEYKTAMPAYSNGGAENKVLDLLPGTVCRCQAFDINGESIADVLYPAAEFIDCTQIYFALRYEADHAKEGA